MKTLADIFQEQDTAQKEAERKAELELLVRSLFEEMLPMMLEHIEAKIPEPIEGEKGDKPILGIDYKIPTVEEIARKVTKPKDGKDGRTPIAGIDFKIPKDGEPGKNGSPDTGEQIINKVNELPIKPEFQIDAKHVKNFPEKVIERITKRIGGGVSVDYKDLSSQLNGSIKTFVLPTHTKVFSIDCSSAPFGGFRPVVDWTETRTSITFTDQVDAAVSFVAGQSLVIWFLK